MTSHRSFSTPATGTGEGRPAAPQGEALAAGWNEVEPKSDDVASLADAGTVEACPVVVLGGSSLITRYLLPRLKAAAYPSAVVTRRPIALPEGCLPVPFEDFRSGRWRVPTGCFVASLLPLPALMPHLAALVQARRIAALGSTGAFSKAASTDPAERSAAQELKQAETALSQWAQMHDVGVTLLRPTLVYDGVGDRNIARMVRFVRRWRVLPLARPAKGLRQPIHADDVAAAIVRALDGDGPPFRAFNIAGGEQLTYRAMAERVFAMLDCPPRLLMVPVGLLEFLFATASRFGLIRETTFGGSIFARMNEDLVYDVAPGLEALGYRPRLFEPGPPRG